jgi:hypothetical protein
LQREQKKVRCGHLEWLDGAVRVPMHVVGTAPATRLNGLETSVNAAYVGDMLFVPTGVVEVALAPRKGGSQAPFGLAGSFPVEHLCFSCGP